MNRESFFEKEEQSEKFSALTEQDKEHVIRIVKSLDLPASHIIDELHQEIRAGKYELIIGDDASGRIPALILGGVIRNINEAQGKPPPEIRFVAGSGQWSEYEGRAEKEEKVSRYIARLFDSFNKKTGHKPKRVLVATDLIGYGTSLGPLITALQENTATFDVATMYIGSDTRREGLESSWGTKIVNGDGGEIYGNRDMGGVVKLPEELFSHLLKKERGTEEDKRVAQQTVNFAREQTALIVQELTEDFLKRYGNKPQKARLPKIKTRL